MNAAVQQLLESTHCPEHGMEWEACCYAGLTLELHNKVADLITTARKDAREAAFRDAVRIVSEMPVNNNVQNFTRASAFKAAAIAALTKAITIKAAANGRRGAGDG